MHSLRFKLLNAYHRAANHLRIALASSSPTEATPAAAHPPAARPETTDVTACYDQFDLGAMHVLSEAPVWMTGAERLALYTLIYATRPKRYLEIGTFRGGSAMIVSAAMDSLSADGIYNGKMVCIDPAFEVAPAHLEKIRHRATLMEAFSPSALGEAQRVAGGPFDFVLVDGDHSYASVLSDFNGVMKHLERDAYVLFHDAYHPDVGRAIADGIRQNSGVLVDAGYLTREMTQNTNESSETVAWCGFRLIRFCPPM
jgi:predicted O-methyltransferase YrrM